MLFCCQSLKQLLFCWFCFIDKYSVLRGGREMQNAIFTISHFQVSGSLDIKKRKKKHLCADCLFVVFFYSFPHLSENNLFPILSSACFICWVMSFHARTQTQADGPSVRQDEPCHEPQTDIMLTLRPSSNHLSPACCATPLDSKLRHTFAIPSRTVFCQHWATLFPHFSKPRAHVGYEMRKDKFFTDLSNRTFAAGRESTWVLQGRPLPLISRNAIIRAVFNTNLFQAHRDQSINSKLRSD